MQGDRVRWETCWQRCFRIWKTTLWLEVINFELTLRMSTSSEPSQEQSFQNGCLHMHISRVILVQKISTVKNFREFNFCCRPDQRQYFNTELFPIYGNYGTVSGDKGWPISSHHEWQKAWSVAIEWDYWFVCKLLPKQSMPRRCSSWSV